jgi:hypothetical protein
MKTIVMEGVREYSEEMSVGLSTNRDGRIVVVASNEGGYNCTKVDLVDLLDWLKANEHLVMATQQKEGE